MTQNTQLILIRYYGACVKQHLDMKVGMDILQYLLSETAWIADDQFPTTGERPSKMVSKC